MIYISVLYLLCTSFLAYGSLDHVQQLRAAGNTDQALQAFDQLVTDEPDNAQAHYEYATYLIEFDQQKYYDKAIELLARACTLSDNLQWQFLLGCQACRYGQLDLSIQTYQHLLERYPNQLPILYNLGYTLKCKEHLQEAIDIYQNILNKHPNYEAAHLGLAFAYIGLGDFESGWKEHEWNLKHQGKDSPELRTFLQHNTVAGKTILLRPEGGLGDSINFLRYVQKLKQMGAYTIVAIQPALMPLLAECDYIDQLIPTKSASSTAFHATTTLMSLAPIFGESQDTLLQNIPYISPSQERKNYWHDQLQHDTNFKIGICWQPSVHNDVSRLPIARRGIPLSHFFELGATPGITLYSLQRIEGLEQLEEVPEEVHIVTFDEHFDNDHGSFMDTAAVMHEMDLIISADTATAHLAGAMGLPVWLLLPYVTDWRWLAHRSDSPWYPTMRIFKQPNPFDWNTTMNKLYETFFNEIFNQRL